MIEKAEYVFQRVNQTGGKRKTATSGLDEVFSKVYNTVIYKIYAFLYSIKLHTKFTKTFCYVQDRIFPNKISRAKNLPFYLIGILPLETFKKQLYINIKLVKSGSVIIICIIIGINLIKQYNRGSINIEIQRQSYLFIFIIENCYFKVQIITYITKFVNIFVNFVKQSNFFEYLL